MNIGPSSEIKVTRFDRKDAGVIDLVRGKIRSQVSKDYLQIDGKNRSKLFIKTPNAVMGIRGTDFLITTTGKNTAAILFEGSVVFNRLSDRKIMDSSKLDDIVDRGVRMFPGEFSAVGENGGATIPALLNVQQRENLEKNKSFAKNNNSAVKTKRSIVPAGLSGSVVASRPALDAAGKETANRSSSNPDHYVKNGNVKPANGSFVVIDTAQIIQPGSDAILDEATNTYISSANIGEVRLDGSFAPLPGTNISNNLPGTNIYGGSSGSATEISDTSNSGSRSSADTNSGPIAGASSGSIIGSALTDPGSAITPVASTIANGQNVQIGDSLNDALNVAPIVPPTTVPGAIDNTTDGATDALKETTGGINRFIGIKK